MIVYLWGDGRGTFRNLQPDAITNGVIPYSLIWPKEVKSPWEQSQELDPPPPPNDCAAFIWLAAATVGHLKTC